MYVIMQEDEGREGGRELKGIGFFGGRRWGMGMGDRGVKLVEMDMTVVGNGGNLGCVGCEGGFFFFLGKGWGSV